MSPGDPEHGNTLWGGDLSYLAENRLPDGDTVPQPPMPEPEPEPSPKPEPSIWWRIFWWPVSPFRSRKH